MALCFDGWTTHVGLIQDQLNQKSRHLFHLSCPEIPDIWLYISGAIIYGTFLATCFWIDESVRVLTAVIHSEIAAFILLIVAYCVFIFFLARKLYTIGDFIWQIGAPGDALTSVLLYPYYVLLDWLDVEEA